MGVNRITLKGNLTRDPELKRAGEWDICKFGLAINERAGKDKEDRVTFVNCTAFGAKALAIEKYLAKGDPLLVFGRLQIRDYEDKDGNKRKSTEVVINEFEFLSGAKVREPDEEEDDDRGGFGEYKTEEIAF